MEKTINSVVQKLKAIPPAPVAPPARLVRDDGREVCPHCGDTKMGKIDKAVLAVLVVGPLLMLGGAIVNAWRG